MRFEMIEGESINLLFNNLGSLNPTLFPIIKFQVRQSPNSQIILEKTSDGGGIDSTNNAFNVLIEKIDTLGKSGHFMAQAFLENASGRFLIEDFNFIIKSAIAK